MPLLNFPYQKSASGRNYQLPAGNLRQVADFALDTLREIIWISDAAFYNVLIDLNFYFFHFARNQLPRPRKRNQKNASERPRKKEKQKYVSYASGRNISNVFQKKANKT